MEKFMVKPISILVTVLLAGLFIGASLLLKKKGIKLSLYTKSLSLLLVAAVVLRYLYEHPTIYNLRGLSGPTSPFNADGVSIFTTGVAVFIVWFGYAAMMTTVLNEFFEYKTLRNIVNCFSLPVYVIILALFDIYTIALFGPEDYSLSTVRMWYTVVELAIGISLPIIKMISQRRFFYPETKKEAVTFSYTLPLALINIMPCWVLQALFTEVDPQIKLFGLTQEHRFMLYFAFIIPMLIYYALRDRPQDVKRFAMIYHSLALMWIYVGRWNLEMLKDPTNLPLHLCNTAMFLLPLCLIFKMNKLFNFCLFINVLGSFIALLMPDVMDGLNAIGTARVSYWVNHYAAFYLAVLFVALKLFKRPKFKEWVYSLIAMAVYFGAMVFLNAWFSNYGTCDYFFLNSDRVTSELGDWAEKTRDYTFTFHIKDLTFTIYPVYQAIFFVVYVAATVGMWFLYEILFASWDAAEDRRLRERDYKRMKKELFAFLGNRTIHEPIDGDWSPRLILRNFSKRYGSNKHYSVNNASLEVRGGEIFGFLGPNGAGKSTIIKSVVGIQTITSGEIEICGFNVEKQPVQAKLNTGFVPDHYALYENLTGREYINYIADLYQVSQKDRDERIEKYVERFQLTGSFDNQMKTYSHGMKQKITIMSALVHNPKVWILDEPLTGLDPTSIHEVKECMKEHAANGNIVFFSSHIIDVVEKICDRIAIIKKGTLRACTTMKELEEKGIELEKFYLDIINDGNDEHVLVEAENLEGSVKEAGAV